MVKASDTGGTRPMDLVGRLARERERIVGMSDAERAFRKQFLKEQELPHNEPRFVPELYKELNNPIRRMYRLPLNLLGNALSPVVGKDLATKIRYFSGKFLMFTYFAFGCAYYFKYNEHNWLRKGGWRRLESRIAVLEGDPVYPKPPDCSNSSDFATKGFNDVTLNL